MAPGKVCLYLPFVVIVCTSMALGMVERPTRTPPPVSVLSKGIPGAPVSSPRQQGYRIAPKQDSISTNRNRVLPAGSGTCAH